MRRLSYFTVEERRKSAKPRETQSTEPTPPIISEKLGAFYIILRYFHSSSANKLRDLRIQHSYI